MTLVETDKWLEEQEQKRSRNAMNVMARRERVAFIEGAAWMRESKVEVGKRHLSAVEEANRRYPVTPATRPREVVCKGRGWRVVDGLLEWRLSEKGKWMRLTRHDGEITAELAHVWSNLFDEPTEVVND